MDVLLKYRNSIFLLFLGVTLSILVGTLYPAEKLSQINIWDYDKLAHFALFAIWTFLFGLVSAAKNKKRPNLWLVFWLSLFFGLAVEILQFILPTNRSPELYDFIADALGSGAAIILLNQIFKNKNTA
ncbi:MAG: VanZ family protein [Balneolaceae bacterium]|nr:VanZ family protein [Balneolaceae bacterium]